MLSGTALCRDDREVADTGSETGTAGQRRRGKRRGNSTVTVNRSPVGNPECLCGSRMAPTPASPCCRQDQSQGDIAQCPRRLRQKPLGAGSRHRGRAVIPAMLPARLAPNPSRWVQPLNGSTRPRARTAPCFSGRSCRPTREQTRDENPALDCGSSRPLVRGGDQRVLPSLGIILACSGVRSSIIPNALGR